MIKYFIEREDGKWLTDPLEIGETWTGDPFIAWTFEEKQSKTAVEVFMNLERRLFWGVPATMGDDILVFLRTEGCCTDCKIKSQEFKEEGGLLFHIYTTARGTKITRAYEGPIHVTYANNITMVHLPVFDGPISNYYR